MSATPIATPPRKLYAVYLGGKAPKANTELHDIVIVTGRFIEETSHRLLEQWFGSPDGLHIDSWMELAIVDGHKISLETVQYRGRQKLFFVNLGAYRKSEFTEIHENIFLAAPHADAAKIAAKARLMQNGEVSVHKDDLFEIESCSQIETLEGFFVHLTPTDDRTENRPQSAYHPLPRALIGAFVDGKRQSA